MRRRAALLVIVALVLTGCRMQDDGMVTAKAAFPDVGDLAPQAPVMLADVQIGKVVEIELEGTQALVTMELDRAVGVPRDVVARTRRTSLLGEKIVDLVVPEGLPPNAELLQDGDRIVSTESRADLEDLVREGNNVLAPIAASELATMINEGGEGFGGKGEELGTMLRNFEAIVDAYAGRTEDIRGTVTSLNAFNSTLAQRADAHARSVANGARSLDMLADNSQLLTNAIRALGRLSVGARSLLDEHVDEMARFFAQMRIILGVLRDEHRSIQQFLEYAPQHNRNTQTTEYVDFVQVYQDFVICGFNDDPSDPARNCEGGGRGS